MPFDQLHRREFITLLAGAAAAWPLAAHAQKAGKMWRIGLIAHEQLKHYDVLFDELRQLGYVEGHNIIVDRRYAQGSAERLKRRDFISLLGGAAATWPLTAR